MEIFHRRRDEWAIPFGLNGLAAVEAVLDRSELDRVRAAGRALGADAAVGYALSRPG
jgi:hypothetical protein